MCIRDSTLTGKASTKIVLESDSLIKMLETLPYDTTRLNVLNQIIRIEQNNQQCIQYSDALMKEALQPVSYTHLLEAKVGKKET